MKLYRSDAALQQEMKETSLPPGTAALWALGQAGFLIQIEDKRLVIDPYLSNKTAGGPWVRQFPAPVTPEQLPELEAVLCTHQHDDHMDASTLAKLYPRQTTQFIIPRAHAGLMASWGLGPERIIGMNHMESATVNGVELRAIAAMHDRFEQDDQGNHRYLGYVIRCGGLTIYHSGDTIGFPELAEWLKDERIDIALIPINGRDYARTAQGIVGNCNYREAADLAAAIGADMVIPMHFGMFAHNDENPAYFVDYLYTRYRAQKFHMMTAGERFIYMK
ncbi:MBL fold metallo-hydrolase [Paenibacillus doosanensis]|uniref:MBL fold metallo-hydrolase n=1 Tax=Paenibacillus doosanensis TaxID=1229154 RepID=UPI00217F6478|nr:MBL fold metallo-hydrolase [Paenibacillus doosanensis]MCS7463026.1 MBL fold metallo-hydrolase [Paenibacillus doosanensis]